HQNRPDLALEEGGLTRREFFVTSGQRGHQQADQRKESRAHEHK
ncbi:MAG: hypothetical protein ACI8T1_005231, partial [Verrucomicrobiales bacterium]